MRPSAACAWSLTSAAQVAKGGYDMEANIALLRFYQYKPATAKIPTVCKILMKALMQMPATDFMLCLYLLPVAVQKDKQIEDLKSLWDKLETCQFKVALKREHPDPHASERAGE